MINHYLKGLMITGFGVFFISPDALFLSLIEASEMTVLFWRGLLLSIGVFFLITLKQKRAPHVIFQEQGWKGLACGLCFASSLFCFVWSIAHTTAAHTLVIISATPLFGALLSRFFFGETIAMKTWLAMLACLAGILLIVIDGIEGGGLSGDIAALGGALSMAGNFTLARHSNAQDATPALVIGGLLTAAIAFFIADSIWVSLRDFQYLVVLCLILLPIGFYLIQLGPRYLSAAEVALVLLLEVLLGPLWVWLVLGEAPSIIVLIGGGIVVVTLFGHASSELIPLSKPKNRSSGEIKVKRLSILQNNL